MTSTDNANGSGTIRLAAPAETGPPTVEAALVAAAAPLIRQAVDVALASVEARHADLREALVAQVRDVRELIAVLKTATAGPAEAAAKPVVARGHLSRRQLAQRLGVSVGSVDRMGSAGGIGPRPVRLGGRVVYDAAEVEQWLAAPRDSEGRPPDRRTWDALRSAQRGKR